MDGQLAKASMPFDKRLWWRKASDFDLENYHIYLNMELYIVWSVIPAEATMCNDPEHCRHRAQIQDYYDGLILTP